MKAGNLRCAPNAHNTAPLFSRSVLFPFVMFSLITGLLLMDTGSPRRSCAQEEAEDEPSSSSSTNGTLTEKEAIAYLESRAASFFLRQGPREYRLPHDRYMPTYRGYDIQLFARYRDRDLSSDLLTQPLHDMTDPAA